MKKNIAILAIVLTLTFVFMGYYQKVEANEEKLLKFLSNLQGVEYEINNYIENFEGYPVHTDKFAQEFYEDFIKGKVEFVVPDYMTDDINDSKFQEYLKKYPKFELETSQTIGDEEDFIVVNKKLPHYNFKIYQINFDDNKSNGIEDIFYSGGYWNDEEDYGYSSYNILNKKVNIDNPYTNTKYYMGGELVEPEYESKDKKRTKNFTGIIKYKGRYYIYEVLDWKIEISCWLEEQKRIATFLRSYY